jgi:hypothetical protein
MIDLTAEDKRIIKLLCRIFRAQKLWIDGVEVNLPKGSCGKVFPDSNNN